MSRNGLVVLFLTGMAALGVALGLRHGLVEAEGLGVLCAQGLDGRCAVRQWVIELFSQNRLGFLSLGAALLALMPRFRQLAWLAWGAAIMGLVLYCFDASAPAALLALLILTRPVSPNNRQSMAQA
ncbi:hypothetical protein [Azovibrio restrictus]|uniref:hypothetical protein n=1 Tax=Azovibrio restrictus TaxID=146938 RepID=UPI0026E9D9FE|nr:hypothetical protein [Azovibrio restrictus]MDD3484411.1 hypothetical protein [Azovibrio restrictus]